MIKKRQNEPLFSLFFGNRMARAAAFAALACVLSCTLSVLPPSAVVSAESSTPVDTQVAAHDQFAQVSSRAVIRSITIMTGAIFENGDSSLLYGTANALKARTEQRVIRRELLFKEGDQYNPFLIKETERNLRLLKYLRSVKVTPSFDGDSVDITVDTRETWTLIPFISYSSGTGSNNRGLGLSESNLAGLGVRLDGRYQEDESRKSYGLAYSDPQFAGTTQQLSLAAFDRSDGKIYSFGYGQPFRSLLQRESWSFEGTDADTVGRLFEAGTEKYIFRQQNEHAGVFYTFAGPARTNARDQSAVSEDEEQYSGIYRGQPILSRRFSVGYIYDEDDFEQADASDYEDLDLDPRQVSNDLRDLPENRRFSGPQLRYQRVQPNYISMNYIDRFDRVEDYNLGDESLLSLHIAPKSLGSLHDSFIATGNRSRGWQFSPRSFLRGEIGGSTRYEEQTLNNTLLRFETKYYNVLGDWFAGDRFLGRHTLAGSFFIDFGEDLDKDRQLLLGADNSLRGYDASTFEGDKRLVLNLEERAHIADDVLQLVSIGTAVFLDVGGTTRDTLGSIVTDDLYADAGVGVRIGFPRAAGGGVVRMDIAFPLRDGPDGSDSFSPRFVFAAGQLFGSRLRSEVVGAENASVGIGFDK